MGTPAVRERSPKQPFHLTRRRHTYVPIPSHHLPPPSAFHFLSLGSPSRFLPPPHPSLVQSHPQFFATEIRLPVRARELCEMGRGGTIRSKPWVITTVRERVKERGWPEALNGSRCERTRLGVPVGVYSAPPHTTSRGNAAVETD